MSKAQNTKLQAQTPIEANVASCVFALGVALWALCGSASSQSIPAQEQAVITIMADRGMALDDYPEALAAFFNYLASDGFRTTIAFADYYDPNTCKALEESRASCAVRSGKSAI